MSNNKPVILVTGSNGQLGNELQELAPGFTDYDFLLATKDDLNIADEAAIENYFSAHSINFCINCAAYTAVDKAESEPERMSTTTSNILPLSTRNNLVCACGLSW